MIKKLITPCNLYVGLWLLIILNPSFAFMPDSLSIALLFLLFLWSLVYTAQCFLSNNESKYIRVLNILFVIFTIYGFLRFVGGETYYIWISGNNTPVGPREFLISYWRSILPIYAFIHFTRNGQLSEKGLTIWTVVFFICAIVGYFGEESQRMAMIPVGTMQDGVTNNQGYAILSILPLTAFFRKKPIIQYFMFAIILVFSIMSYKRGAMVIAFFSILCGLFLFKNKSKFFGFLRVAIIASVLIFITINLFNWNIENSSYFMMKLEDTLSGENSGRRMIFTQLAEYLLDQTSLLTMMIGAGADATFLIIGQAAHNDWLEIAVDMGLFGLIAYVAYYICFFKFLIDSKAYSTEIHQCVFFLFLICFLRSFFSMSINDMSLYLTMAVGYSVSMVYNKSMSNVVG